MYGSLHFASIVSAVFFLSCMDLGAASSCPSVTVHLCRCNLPRRTPPPGLPTPWRVPSWVGQLPGCPTLESTHSLFTQAPCTVPVEEGPHVLYHSVPVLCGRRSGPWWFWRLCSFWPAWQPRCRRVHLGLLERKRCAVFSHCVPGAFVAVPVSCLSEAPDSCPGCQPPSWSARL